MSESAAGAAAVVRGRMLALLSTMDANEKQKLCGPLKYGCACVLHSWVCVCVCVCACVCACVCVCVCVCMCVCVCVMCVCVLCACVCVCVCVCMCVLSLFICTSINIGFL